jgi:ubiquinone/menaquinone biosynthesis C-methylase UbiE
MDEDSRLSGWRPEEGFLFQNFPVGKDDVVADIGCGTGELVGQCADFGAKLIAVDIDPRNVDVVREKLKAKGADFEAYVSDAAPLPLPDGVATRIISTEVIEHVDDVNLFFAELVRIGKPGALYLLSVPAPETELLLKRIAAPAAFEKPNHVRIVGRKEFAEIVRNAGLIIEQRAFFGFVHSLQWLMFWLDDEPNTELIRIAWQQLWGDILKTRNGPLLKSILDGALPKQQVILARKPEALP